MEARSGPPPRGDRPPTPEEDDAERERVELAERFQAARRWAYFATFVAFLAAAVAAVAIATQPDDRGGQGASRAAVRDLQGDVAELQDQTEAARAAGLEAQDTAESISNRLDDLEGRVASANEPDEATQQELEQLNQDVQQLQEEVDRAGQDADSGGSSP